MELNKLRIKIGDNELETEGTAEVVQAQLAAFKELLSATPTPQKSTEATIEQPSQDNQPQRSMNNGPLALEKIMRVEGRVVSLTTRANSLEDAVMLLLFGQKTLRNNDAITGFEIVNGLRVSGQSADRLARVLHKIAEEGAIIITGAHRGKKYRMTNQGMTKAQEIAKSTLALVA
jgi:hypothetical protein